MSELSFSRRTSSERDLQPVAITSVDPVSRTATGITRTRHAIHINCAYATGDTITIPAVGEQWYCERFDMEWRLYGRIPFNDATLNIEPEEGQVSVGSASGPLELNGTEIRSNGKVFRLNGIYYRDSGETLERSVDQIIWEPVGGVGVIQLVAYALAGTPNADAVAQLLERLSQGDSTAITVLQEWSATLATNIWGAICDNPFFVALRQLGMGDTPVDEVITGFQNFINDFFKVLFCGFTGDLTPQIALASFQGLADLFANNPFIQGLQALAEALGVAIGQPIADAVTGITAFFQQIFTAIFCGFTGDFTPQAVLDTITGLLDPLKTNPFILGLQAIATELGVQVDNLFSDAVNGAIGLIDQIFRFFFCGFTGDLTPQDIFQHIQDLFQPIIDNPFVQGFQALATEFGVSVGNLFGDIINGLIALVDNLFRFFFCDFTGDLTPLDIVQHIKDLIQPLIDNPFLNGLKDLATAAGIQITNLFDGAVQGTIEFIRIVFGLLRCDPTELLNVANMVIDVIPGAETPLAILATLSATFTNLLLNPLIAAIQNFATQLGLGDGTLLSQLVAATGQIGLWVAKILTTFVPLGIPTWKTLIPLGDTFWDAVDTIDPTGPLAVLLDPLANLNPLALFKPLEDLLTGALTGATGALADFFTALGNVGGFFDNLTDLLGVDLRVAVADFDLNAAISAVLTTVFGGAFGTTVTEVTRFFTRIRNLFGLNLADLTDITSFNFATAAAGLINNVLVNAPNTAVLVLQGIVETITSLSYKVAEAVISGLRGFPFGLLNGVADFLQTLMTNFTGYQRGSVDSGSNALSDPSAEKSAFWSQPGVLWQNAPKRSGGGSLAVSGGNYLWWNVNDLAEITTIKTQAGEYFHAECYVYSYFNATVYLYMRAKNSLTGAYYDYYLTNGTVTASNPSGFTKVEIDVAIPDGYGWDRITFGLYSVNYQVFVDDMLVREITAAQAVKSKLAVLNQALYLSNDTPAGTTPKIKVDVIPTGIPPTSVTSPTGSGTVGSDIGSVYNTLTGNTSGTGTGGLVATVGNASSGLVQKTNSIVTNTFNAWYGSGSTGTATEMGTVIGSIKTTVSNTWTVMVLPYGTTTWYRTSNGASNGTPYSVDKFLEFWVVCVGSGAGGGKGQVGYPGQANPGGNGGLGGKWFAKQLNPANLPSSANLIIGAGGAGKTSGTVDAANNRSDTQFGYGYQTSFYVSTAEIQTASVASIISYYAATDSQPGDGGTGATGNGSGVQAGFGESTPLATGGLGGISAGGGGGVGSIGGSGGDANNTGQQRAGGGGGGGGGAGTYQNGGNGGSGGVPGGGGGGGGGAWASGGPVGGNGGTGGHGCIILLYRLAA